jgi:hypothetical protein
MSREIVRKCVINIQQITGCISSRNVNILADALAGFVTKRVGLELCDDFKGKRWKAGFCKKSMSGFEADGL